MDLPICENLLSAVKKGRMRSVILYVDEERQKILVDAKGRTAIHLALKWPDILEYILPKMLEYVNTKDHNGDTPLHYIPLFDIRCCEILFKYAGDKIDLNVRNLEGETPLFRSINISNNPEYALYLISKGADINIPNNELETPLHISAMFENLEPFKTLVLLNAKNTLNKRGEDVLYYAFNHEAEREKFLYILENEEKIGLDQVNIEYKGGNNILHIAVHGTPFIFKKLSKKNLEKNVNKRNFLGQTPLHVLMESVAFYGCKLEHEENCIEIIKYLIEYGVDSSIRDFQSENYPNGRTPAECMNPEQESSVRITKFLNEWQELPS